MPTFEEAKVLKARIQGEVDRTSTVMRQYPANGPMGMVEDAIKFSPAYRADKSAFDAAFADLRKINSLMSKLFKKELAQERRARRAA